MATNTAGSSARQDPRQVSNTIRATIVNSANMPLVQQIGVLPQGAFLLKAIWDISVAFTGAPTFGVGTDTPTDANIVSAATATGVIVAASADAKLGRVHAAAADVPIFIKFTAAGAAGTMDITIEYEGGFPG